MSGTTKKDNGEYLYTAGDICYHTHPGKAYIIGEDVRRGDIDYVRVGSDERASLQVPRSAIVCMKREEVDKPFTIQYGGDEAGWQLANYVEFKDGKLVSKFPLPKPKETYTSAPSEISFYFSGGRVVRVRAFSDWDSTSGVSESDWYNARLAIIMGTRK